jgi:hypothetical protein
MSEDDVRAEAVKVVKEHLEISDKTRVKTSIGTAAAIIATIIGSCVGGTWAVGRYVENIEEGQSRIESIINYKVSVSQFKAWANALDKQNRKLDGGNGLNVPDVPDVPTGTTK